MVPAVSAYIPANEFMTVSTNRRSCSPASPFWAAGHGARRSGSADPLHDYGRSDEAAPTPVHSLGIGLIGHDPWFNLMCGIAEPGRIKPHLRAQQRKLAEEISDFSVTEYGADDHDGGRQLDEIFRYGSGGLTAASLFLAARATGWVDGNVVRLVSRQLLQFRRSP